MNLEGIWDMEIPGVRRSGGFGLVQTTTSHNAHLSGAGAVALLTPAILLVISALALHVM